MVKQPYFRILALFACAAIGPALAAKQARGYSHGFERGNLIPNWSFEATGQTWDASTAPSGFTVDPRFRMASLGGTNKAVSGAFVGRLSGTSNIANASGTFGFNTPYYPISSNIYNYTLSFYVKSSGVQGTVRPVIRFYRDMDPNSLVGTFQGDPYQNYGDWTLITLQTISPPSQANYFRLGLAETYAVGDGGTFYFDDIVLEEITFTPRNRVQEDVAYVDALGRPFQGQSYSSGSRVSPFPGYGHSGRIRINTSPTGVDTKADVHGFPLLVRLSNSNFVFSEASSTGADIRFTDAMGNPLSYEIEDWNPTASPPTASIWVNVPLIQGNKADNDIYMYWGNSSASSQSSGPATFGSDSFVANYHTDGKPGDPMAVSPINSVTGNADATAPDASRQAVVAGQIVQGMDASTGLFIWDQRELLNDLSGGAYTLSAWMKLSAFGTNPPYTDIVAINGNFCLDYRNFYIANGKLILRDWVGNQFIRWETPNPVPADNATFHHVAVSFDQAASGDPEMFFDGVKLPLTKVPEGPSSINVTTLKVRFGDDCNYRGSFYGVLDEMRVEKTKRPSDWIKLSYQNQKSGSTVAILDRSITADHPQENVNGSISYDAWGHPAKALLPCQSQSGDLADPATCSVDPDMPDMGGFNYAQANYSADPIGNENELGFPGANNSIGSGHSAKTDYYYVATLGIPSNIETPPAAAAGDTVYKFSWSKDPDGNYLLTWKNRKGQTVQKASNATRNTTTTPNLWSWSFTQNDFFQNGGLKRVHTPLDVANNNTTYSQVMGSDAAGRTRSMYDPDQGLVRHWYNRRGQVRYAQDQGQRATGTYSYLDYDSQGRLLSKGSQVPGVPLTQANADLDSYSAGTKKEGIGYLYDDLSTFSSRTGVVLSDIIPDWYYLKPDLLEARNGFGRMTCKYNLNPDNPLSGFGQEDRLVAEFYLYNRDGSISNVFKYFGPVRSVADRYQEVSYLYDATGRVEDESVYQNIYSGNVSINNTYEYDDRGRLKRVRANYGAENIVDLSYMNWGPLKSVVLGGNGDGVSGTKVEYSYHALGGIKEIRATQLSTGKIIFQQLLGYDGKADGNAKVPANNPRYSGEVTQQLYKFADDVNAQRPVRVVNYDFDEMGRMLTADFQQNGTGTALNADGSINYDGFASFENVPANDTRMTYDLNGRILTQASDGSAQTAAYNYKTASYKLDNVTGRLSSTSSRDMSAAGTFVYDGRGAMIQDKSKDLMTDYDWNSMPYRFTQGSTTDPTNYWQQYCFYDADGNRVSSINFLISNGVRAWMFGKHYLNMGSKPYKEFDEQYSGSGGSAVTSSVETQNLFGPGVVGRKNRGDTEYFLYDHLGSLRMTVDPNGNEPSRGRIVNDYLAYGDRRKLKDNGAMEPITQSFSGKEYDDLYGLYYFGVRYYDAELAVWMSQDPAGQFINPYSFNAWDPLNRFDPTGMFSLHKLWRQTKNIAVQTGDFVVDNKEAFAMAAIVVGSVALGGTPALIAAGYGAAIGAGIGGGVEVGRQLVSGKSLDELSFSKIGAAALSGGLVGAATGGLAGAAGGASFLGSATPFLHGATNGAVLATGTGVGGLIGSGVGAANGNTSSGILTGGTDGFLIGSAVVGGAYAASGANYAAGLFAKATGFQLSVSLQGLSTGLSGAALGAAPGLAGAYYEARGFGHERSDVKAATKAAQPVENVLNCIPSPGKFNTDGAYYETSPGHPDLQKNEYTSELNGTTDTQTDYTITGSPAKGRYVGEVAGGSTVDLNSCLDQ